MSIHQFHIPVMGLGFTLDTPIKVARYGIDSTVSIVEDQLIEKMRAFYCKRFGFPYHPIKDSDDDARAMRIRLYLELMQRVVAEQMEAMRRQPLEPGTDLMRYFELLKEDHPIKATFQQWEQTTDAVGKQLLEDGLRRSILPGRMDVNIMTKVDKTNYDRLGNRLDPIYSDALAALRGFATSSVVGSVVFSAGLNPRLYSYCAEFDDFFPSKENDLPKKGIVLKVSDFRSAQVQSRFFAKKGLWVSEFRVESGLNCGGHAFATEGLLIGPILKEFKEKRHELSAELFEGCQQALRRMGRAAYAQQPIQLVSAQGGLGTAGEHQMLIQHYGMDKVGWGSPFLLVPEATSVDEVTLQQLAQASPSDYYLSGASPLGVPFNNFRPSTSLAQHRLRVAKNRPGSPCYKKYLVTDTEFTQQPVCTASRQYQAQKLSQLDAKGGTERIVEESAIVEKECLCEGLGASILLRNKIQPDHKLTAVSICPGPNLAFFSGVFTLKQMIGHIYGQTSLLNTVTRPHLLINELNLYVDYLRSHLKRKGSFQIKSVQIFIENLFQGVAYYRSIVALVHEFDGYSVSRFLQQLAEAEEGLLHLQGMWQTAELSHQDVLQ